MELQLPSDAEAFAALQQDFEENGRCSIQPILSEDDAEAFERFLIEYADWARIRGLRNQRFDIPPGTDLSADPQLAEDHRQIEQAIASDASKSFALLYDAIPMTPDTLPQSPDNPLVALRDAMNAPQVFEWMKRLSGEAHITGTEIQATKFGAGDFLSTHHDGPNIDRKIAAVLGLSRDWSVDWGGNLLFLCADDGLQGIIPGFNRLDLFAVPQFHCVSAVSRAAPRPRLAVSGWFVG